MMSRLLLSLTLLAGLSVATPSFAQPADPATDEPQPGDAEPADATPAIAPSVPPPADVIEMIFFCSLALTFGRKASETRTWPMMLTFRISSNQS